MVLKMPASLSYIFLSLMIASHITQTVAMGPTEQDLEKARKDCEAKNKLFCPKYGKCCEHTDFCHEGTCETCFPINMTEDSRLAFCQQLFNNSSPLPMRSNSCDHFLVCRSLFSFKELLNVTEQEHEIKSLKETLSATQNEITQLKEDLAHQKDLSNKTQILEQKETKKLEEELKLMKQSLNSTFLEKAKFEKEVKEIRDELAHQKDLHNKTLILEQQERQKLQDDLLQSKQILSAALGLGIFGTLAGIGGILAFVAFVVVRLVKTDWFTYLFPKQFLPAVKLKNYQYEACPTNGEASNKLVAQNHEQYVTTHYVDGFVKSNLKDYVKNGELLQYVKMNTLNKYVEKVALHELYLDKKDIEEHYLPKKDIEERYLDKKDIEERYLDKKDIEERYLDKKDIEERYLDKEELEEKFKKKDNPKTEKPALALPYTNAPEEAKNDIHIHRSEDCTKMFGNLELRVVALEKDIKHQLKGINAKLRKDEGVHVTSGIITQSNKLQQSSPDVEAEIDLSKKDKTDEEKDCLIPRVVGEDALTIRQHQFGISRRSKTE